MMMELVPQTLGGGGRIGGGGEDETTSTAFSLDDDDLIPLVNITTSFRPQEQARLSWRPHVSTRSRKWCWGCCRFSQPTLYRCSLSANVLLLGILFWMSTNLWLAKDSFQRLGPDPTTTIRNGHQNITFPNTVPSAARSGTGPLLVYGHLHIEQTASTEINHRLVSRFERICGSKGYSYDAFQVARNNKIDIATNNNQRQNDTTIDLASKNYLDAYNRSNVPNQVMTEIGYEDCDYISREGDWKFWKGEVLSTFAKTNTKNNMLRQVVRPPPNIQVELHVPCREDPLDHALSLLSSLYYAHVSNVTSDNDNADNNSTAVSANLTCNDDWKDTIDNLLQPTLEDRFSMTLLYNGPPSINNKNTIAQVSCFSPIPVEPYISYMSQRLQRRRVVFDYNFDTNNKVATIPEPESENPFQYCIDDWKEGKNEASEQQNHFENQIREYLVETIDYFRFCEECMGSTDEIDL